jgi:hypothetical protein
MAARTQYAMTASQREHLLRLREAAATDRARAVTAADSRIVGFLHAGVVGILIDKGFAAKATRRRAGGSQATIYWLTEAGLGTATLLAVASKSESPAP